MHPQTLRMYEARGLIEPQRSPKGTRLYSQEDVEKLRRIQEMTAELGLNLAGVERVLDLEARDRADARAHRGARAQALHAQVRSPRSSRRCGARSAPSWSRSPRELELVRAADARSPFTALPQRKKSNDSSGGNDAA